MAGYINKIKDSFTNIKDGIILEEFDRNSYGFISLNNGAGSKTVATAVAVELSKKYRVCVVDCNFVQPGMGIMLNTPIRPDMSILGYFNSSMEIKDCVHTVNGNKNLFIVSTSPVDDPIGMADISEDLLDELLDYLNNSFDYLIYNMNYNPFAEWFVTALNHVDKSYIVWDEQIENSIMTKAMIDYMHKISYKATSINNIILTKRTKYLFPYKEIEKIECKLIAELPFAFELMKAKYEGTIYNEKIDKPYHKQLVKIIQDIESEQKMRKDDE